MPRLWLVSDPVRLPDPRAAAARLPAGSGVLARGAAEEVLRDLSRGPSRLVVGWDGRAALRHRAGLHLPEREVPGLLPFLAARRGGAPWAWLTVAVHGRRALARARRLRPDAGFVSPAFPTTSHPGAPALGPLRWAALARCLPCPAVALGGVAPGSAGRLPQCRAAGLAAIGALRSRI
ncbi:MAG TPA: thiamine phosphate synthase [Acetobacteraceae bacterium]|nr:thiamine phosphate synthase [Acetobacteraceae bacterium]